MFRIKQLHKFYIPQISRLNTFSFKYLQSSLTETNTSILIQFHIIYVNVRISLNIVGLIKTAMSTELSVLSIIKT